MNKNSLDSLVSKHYDRLLRVSFNIVRRSVSSKGQERSHNMLHEVFIQLYDKLDKFDTATYLNSDEDFLKYVTAYLKNYHTYMTRKRHSRMKDNVLFTYYPEFDREGCSNVELSDWLGDLDKQVDYKTQDLIYIDCENIDDLTKLFLKDLTLNDIPIEKGLMVNKIKAIGNTFTGAEREIFDMYYLQEITCKQIHEELKRTNMNAMPYYKIREIRAAIHKKILDRLNA